jgi:Ni,Fe-hydrogenase I cytochrome b subunit
VASLLVGNGADLARMSFVLLLIPGLILAGLGMFGRQPKEGDVRWYLRSSMRTVYRAGGVLLVMAAIYLTQFAPIG